MFGFMKRLFWWMAGGDGVAPPVVPTNPVVKWENPTRAGEWQNPSRGMEWENPTRSLKWESGI